MPLEPVTAVRTPCALALPARAKRARREEKDAEKCIVEYEN